MRILNTRGSAMPCLYLDDIATADAAFEAWGETLQELLRAATEV
jgi:hypothetical protein